MDAQYSPILPNVAILVAIYNVLCSDSKDNHSTQSMCIESILAADAHASLQSLKHTTYVL